MEDDVDDLHVEIELEMAWITYSTLRGLDVLHVEVGS